MRITSDPGNTFELETRLFGTRRYLVRREYGQGHRRCWEVLKDDGGGAMITRQTRPMAKASCEDCDWSRPERGWTERVAGLRATAQAHARRLGHHVFVEKATGSLYVGTRRDHRVIDSSAEREGWSTP